MSFLTACMGVVFPVLMGQGGEGLGARAGSCGKSGGDPAYVLTGSFKGIPGPKCSFLAQFYFLCKVVCTFFIIIIF